MATLLIFAFISGLITILAPCIWPLLPIILSSTTSGGKRKPLGITFGLMLSFGISTLAISYLVRIFSFDPNTLRIFAVLIIGLLGLTLVIPYLGQKLESVVSFLTNKLNISTNAQSEGYWSGMLTGLALGLVWTPCAGPILATIATLAATQSVNFSIVLVTFAYVLGVGIPLFIFASLGTSIFAKAKVLNKYTKIIQQIFGAIMIATALAIYTNYDKVLQTYLLDKFPAYSDFVFNLEDNAKVQNQLDLLTNNKPQINAQLDKAKFKAPEFTGINNWLNTESPLTMNDLKGKVVLVDFWTYTCINCIRTLPYVTAWYEKYKDQGLVVVGVHTPEFAFEKETSNVQNALEMYKINYPVAQDNDYKTWQAYNNRYWPAHYLIDANGYIRKVHFGEGGYAEMESAIQTLLAEAGNTQQQEIADINELPKYQTTPETYLGLARMERFTSNELPVKGVAKYSYDQTIGQDEFAYSGIWNLSNEYAQTSQEDAELILAYKGQKVFLVMSPVSENQLVEVYLDDKLISAENAGSDVVNGIVTINRDGLYELVNTQTAAKTHLLKLIFKGSGIKVFAFTFG